MTNTDEKSQPTTTDAFLRSRGWALLSRRWRKRGWRFARATSAKLCEDYYEQTYGAVTPRDEATAADLAELMRRRQNEGL